MVIIHRAFGSRESVEGCFVNNNNKIPPKIHNLVRLAEISSLKLDEETRLFLDKVNDFNLDVRYPEYKNEFYKTCTKEFAENHLKKIEELYQWLKSRLK